MEEADETGNGNAGENLDLSDLETTTVNFEQPGTLVGQRLDGRFLIEKNLTDDGGDVGGIGVVYRAQDMKLMGREVVVKILQEKALQHKDIVRKFLHEKEALIRLDHPGIVRILDSGTLSDGNPFMVMEFIEGYSLRKALERTRQLPLDAAANVIESVAEALAAAHSKNILHRDIKPENIMLTPQEDGPDRVRLIDFGIARVGNSQLAPETEISRAIGTILYIAPEQLIGRLDVSVTADIYAAAIVAYEMVTGKLPFRPKTHAEMYELEREGVKIPPRELRRDLPEAAEKMILSALSFDPKNRPQSVRAFGRDMARALRGDAVSGYDSSDLITEVVTRISPDDPPPKPRPLLKWAAVGVLALAAVSVPTGYVIVNGLGPLAANKVNSNPNVDPAGLADLGPERQLSYFLMVQKMRNKKPFEAPFQSSGREVYENGYKFTLNFQADADGYMYVFNEGPDEQGNKGFYLLFPTPSINGGSAQVTAAKNIETAQNTFTGGKGSELMWMVWSKEKRDDLEAAAKSATASGGQVMDIAGIGTLTGLIEKYKGVKSETTKDTANQRTVIKTNGDIVVYRFELEHR